MPHIYPAESFVAGSLGRRTQSQPLDDIDVYLVVNAGGMQMYADSTPEPVSMYGSNPNPLVYLNRYWRDGWISPDRLLEEFLAVTQAIAIRTESMQAGIGAKRRTLFLRSGELVLNIDIALVLRGENEVQDRYYLPDGNGKWKATNPKSDQRRISDMNQAHDGKLLPIVRLLKWWNANVNESRIKGIHLEVMVENAALNKDIASPFAALRFLFPALRDALTAPCPDPTGLGPDLDSRLSVTDRDQSATALREATRYITLAGGHADLSNEEDALVWLRRIFPV